MDFWKAHTLLDDRARVWHIFVWQLWCFGFISMDMFLHHMLHFRAASRHFDLGTVRLQGCVYQNRCASLVFEVQPSMNKCGLTKMSSR